jgi:tetratricopeptide (TPR) repeat protein
MRTLHQIGLLQKTLQPTNLRFILKLIARDELFVPIFTDEEMIGFAKQKLGEQIEHWTPANLALILVDPNLVPFNQANNEQSSLSLEVRHQAVQIFDEYRKPTKRPLQHLSEAGLLAIAFHERFRIRNTWEGILAEIPAENWPLIKTSLACVFSILNNPLDLLLTLIAQGGLLETCMHSIYCQPLESQKQARLGAAILATAPIEEQYEYITNLAETKPEEAQTLAAEIYDSESESISDQINRDTENSRLSSIPRQAFLAEILRLSSRKVFSNQKRSDLLNSLDKFQGEILQGFLIDSVKSDDLNAIDELLTRQYSDHVLDGTLVFPAIVALLKSGNFKKALLILENAKPDELFQLAQAYILENSGEKKSARRLIRPQQFEIIDRTNWGIDIYLFIIELLIGLEKPYESLHMISRVGNKQSDNAQLAYYAACAYRKLGHFEEAEKYALLAVSIQPHTANYRRELAECLEGTGKLQEALEERQAVIELELSQQKTQPTRTKSTVQNQADYQSYALCALKSGNIERALAICWELLEKNPDDGLTHLTIGQIYENTKAEEIALEHYARANLLIPANPHTWLALARLHQTQKNFEAAIEILQTATQVIPDDPEIHLLLGELYHLDEHTTQAYNEFKKAAEFIGLYPLADDEILQPSDTQFPRYLTSLEAQIALQLGICFLELGHVEQANQILALVFNTNEYKTQAAHAYARTFMSLGEDQKALSVLSIAYQNQPYTDSLALEYAQLLARSGEQPALTTQVLERILSTGSQIPEAVGLMAESLAAENRFDEAMIYYQKAMETPLMGDPRWSIRLTIGLSHIAIKLNRPDVAIACLQESIQTSPQHLTLHQKLSEAYIEANLVEDSLAIAQRAKEIAPVDINNLAWYANLMLKTGRLELAHEALIGAVELSPKNAYLLNHLASTYQQLGDSDKAIECYQKAIELPEITLIELHNTAAGLINLNHAEMAIASLEKVRESVLPEISELSSMIIFDLANAYEQSGNYQAALDMLEETSRRETDSPNLLIRKAKIHHSIGQPAAALACLNQVIRLNPEDAEVHQLAMEYHENLGNLALTHSHALQFYNYAPDKQKTRAQYQAARTAWNLFLTKETLELLGSPNENPSLIADQKSLGDQLVLQGLILAQSKDVNGVLEMQDQLSKLAIEHPFYECLAAVCLALQNDVSRANDSFFVAYRTITQNTNTDDLAFETLLEAALLLHHWQEAQYLISRWQVQSPMNPRGYLAEIRTLALCAETRNFLSAVGIRKNLPMLTSGMQEEQDRFDQATYQTLKLCGLEQTINYDRLQFIPSIPTVIWQWIIRGKAAISLFDSAHKNSEHLLLQELSRLAPIPENGTAYASALRRSGNFDLAVTAANNYPYYANALAEKAISRMDTKAAESLAYSLAAIENVSSTTQMLFLPAFYALIALAANQAGEPAQAYQAMYQALTDWPDEAYWHKLAADYAAELDQPTTEIQHLEKAISLEPGSIQLHIQLADTYIEHGSINRAIVLLENVCELDPYQSDHWIRLAEVQTQKNEYLRAADAIKHALHLQPDNPDIILYSAELAFALGNYQHSQEKSRLILEKDPENAKATFLLARSLSVTNQKQEAIQVLDNALKFANRPVQLYLERIRLVRSLQGIQPAYQSLVALSKQYPDHPAILALLAEYQLEHGMTSDALNTAQRSLQLAETQLSNFERARLHTIIGRIQRKSGQLDQAIHQLNTAIQLNPQQIDLYLELGRAYQDRRQHQEAMEVYQKAIDLSPDDPRPYQQAGAALKESKDYVGAEKMIRRAAELSPHDVSIHRLLGSLVALNLVHNEQ